MFLRIVWLLKMLGGVKASESSWMGAAALG